MKIQNKVFSILVNEAFSQAKYNVTRKVKRQELRTINYGKHNFQDIPDGSN